MLGWDQSQVRTWDGINRHTALAALAQLRQIAIRNALTGVITLPAAPGTGGPGHGDGTAGDEHVSDADLRIPLGDAPLPARGGQPCPPRIAAIRLSVAETARLTALARQAAAGLLTRARLAFALRWSCDGDATRPPPAGTTTAPGSSRQPPDSRRPEGGDSM